MHSYRAKELGNYIFNERAKKKILQYELAKKLKMTGQFLGRIEKGEVQMPEDKLVKCIDILELNPSVITKIYKQTAEMEARDLMRMARGVN